MLIIGAYIFLFSFILGMIVYEKYKLDYIVECSEDILTSSALGGLYLTEEDKAVFSITGEVPFEASGLEQRCEKIISLCTTSFEDGNIASGEIKIKEITMYSVRNGAVTSYTFTNPKKNLPISPPSVGSKNVTNGGTLVEKTGIYLEAEIPVKAFGREHIMTKGVFVAIKGELN